ncbi:MAG: histidine phosphatase family protein [Candidatus Moraniibacteriota bacterium]
MITFYLVRHGEAENNVRFILNSLPENKTYSLTERGKEQVVETAQFLVTVGADAMFSSPILRAKETAEIIARVTGLSVEFDERLCEAGMGVFNGKMQQELLKKYPTAATRISPDGIDGVESFIDMRGRLKSFLDDVQEKYSGKKVIIVSHGDPLEQLHGILTNEAPGQSATGWYPDKGSYTEVIWREGS